VSLADWHSLVKHRCDKSLALRRVLIALTGNPTPLHKANSRIEKEEIPSHSELSNSVMNQGSMRSNRFDVLAEQLLDQEALRVKRGELSSASVGISQPTECSCIAFLQVHSACASQPVDDGCICQAMTDFKLRSTTVSQYLVVLRKLLKLAIRHGQFLLVHAEREGFGSPEDHVSLPDKKDRGYVLAVLGFGFKWVMREAGVAPEDAMGRLRTLDCLRHTSIMFRLLYGQGIDMLTLARNAKTSVQMIERFYASALDGEMNVGMLQSR
jgi:hypothetical protein